MTRRVLALALLFGLATARANGETGRKLAPLIQRIAGDVATP